MAHGHFVPESPVGAAPVGPESKRSSGWPLAIAATLTMAVSYFDRQTLAVLAPTVTKELHIDDTGFGWLVSAFSLAYLIGSPLAGILIDRVGARRGLLGAVIAWSIVAAMHALVPSFGVLFALRILLGLTESPSFPGSAQTVTRALPPSQRARGFGILFTGSSIGAMLAPPLASYLATHFGWRSAFLGTAIAGLVWIPMWVLIAFRPSARAILDGPASSTSVSTDSKSAADTPKEPVKHAGFFETLAHPAVLRASIVVLGTAPLASFVLNWSAKYLARTAHIPQAEMGKFLWVTPVLFDIGSIAFGSLASSSLARSGGRRPVWLFFGCGVLGASVALMSRMPGPWAAMIVAGLAVAGIAGLFAIFTADMLSKVGPTAAAKAGGITAAVQSLAYVIANPLIGRAVDRSGSYTGVTFALAALVIPSVLVWIFWRQPGDR